MGIGAAIAGAAVAGLGGAIISGQAAKSAAGTQASAAEQASQNQLAVNQENIANLAPYRTAGATGTSALLESLGLPGGAGPNLLQNNGISGLTFQPTQAQLAATPGYQFDLAQGLQSVQNANAAQGRGISGAALKGAASYATGLANNTLTTQQGIFQSNLGNVLGSETNLANLGENAAAQTGQLANQGQAQVNQLQVGAANANAAGTVGAANAASSGLSSVGNAGLNYALYSQLLNSGGGTPGSIGSAGVGEDSIG